LSNMSENPLVGGETWYLLRTGARTAAENMAVDEVLLESVGRLSRPILRFYGWSEPAASFGYSQRYHEIARLTALRPLVRRPTGGGLVPHDADWTYSVIFPPSAAWYSLRAIQSYERVHAWVQAAFDRIKISTRLAPNARKEAPGQCFIGAEQFDVLWADRKIAGGAQRRNRQGLLIQGSIQPPAGAVRSDWEREFCGVAEESWAVSWESLDLDRSREELIRHRAFEKFGTAKFTERR
jgi:lipoate-protein ligase A